MTKKEFLQRFFNKSNGNILSYRERVGGVHDRVVVNIPARGGSSRVKDKNIAEVCGKPLLAYTILFARHLPGVDRIVVNTDSEEYATIARQYGAEAPFLRPEEISRIESRLYWQYLYLLHHLISEEYPVGSIITLLATNPLRNIEEFAKMVESLRECGLVRTCFSVDFPDEYVWLQDSKRRHRIDNLPDPKNDKQLVKFTGHFSGQKVYTRDIKCQEIFFLANILELLDVDTQQDIDLLRYIVQNNLYDFGCPL